MGVVEADRKFEIRFDLDLRHGIYGLCFKYK